MSFKCGVCKKDFPGSPSGGFNTRHGEVITCSTDCFLEGVKVNGSVTAQQMWNEQAKNKPKN